MLATMRSPSKEVLRGLVPDFTEKPVSAKPAAAWKTSDWMIHENILRQDWPELHAMLINKGSRQDCDVMDLAFTFTDEDWACLRAASREVFRISRLPPPLNQLRRFIITPININMVLCNTYNTKPATSFFEAYSLEDYPESIRRWMLAYYTSICGALFNIFSQNPDDRPLARVLNALLYARPYRQDWRICPLMELQECASFIHEAMRRFYADLEMNKFREEARTCGMLFYTLARNCQALFQNTRATREAIKAETLKPRLGGWMPHTAHGILYPGKRKMPPLPNAACGIEINRASGAVAPFFPAMDEVGLYLALFPQRQSVWNAMLAMYDMPKRDELYPEAVSARMRLAPNGSMFVTEISKRHNLVYLGNQSLGKYLEIKDPDNPDYQFHAFIWRNPVMEL